MYNLPLAFVLGVVFQNLHWSELKIACLAGLKRPVIELTQLLTYFLHLGIFVVLAHGHSDCSLPEVRIVEHVSVAVALSDLVAGNHSANPRLHLDNQSQLSCTHFRTNNLCSLQV